MEILKQSVDARKKEAVKYVYTVALATENDVKYIRKDISYYINIDISLESATPKKNFSHRPVVVGSGPCGLFCALVLAYAGAKPIVLERGEAVEEREKTIRSFFDTLVLSPNSNVQFGEGGAGTFSDGKLNTNLHNVYIPMVLQEFVDCGAPQEILYLAKPHIGTDNLRLVVRSMREKIISFGGSFLYNCTMTGIKTVAGQVVGVETTSGFFPCRALFLAIGHSSRDTFERLYDMGVRMESKIFSMGVRIEHRQKDINFAQYGSAAKYLGAADYKMATRTETGRSLYTFCMCPGGRVINASSEDGGVCVNGMSLFRRNDKNANSALLVNVGEEDWQSTHPLAGMYYQREYERKTFAQSRSFRPVVQLYGDLLQNKTSTSLGGVTPSLESGYVFGNLRDCLPAVIVDTLVKGIPDFGRKIKGFDAYESVLTGIEARSSSPVRILRDDAFRSSLAGLYPLGEGAGYAGGITSAAIDGIKGAFHYLKTV